MIEAIVYDGVDHGGTRGTISIEGSGPQRGSS